MCQDPRSSEFLFGQSSKRTTNCTCLKTVSKKKRLRSALAAGACLYEQSGQPSARSEDNFSTISVDDRPHVWEQPPWLLPLAPCILRARSLRDQRSCRSGKVPMLPHQWYKTNLSRQCSTTGCHPHSSSSSGHHGSANGFSVLLELLPELSWVPRS